MNRSTKPDLTVMLLVAAALALWPVAVLAATEAPLPEATPKPAEAADADAEAAHDDLADLLKEFTPEQLAELVKRAAANRLTLERRQVAMEIDQGILYEPDDIKAAGKILSDKPANTQKDNIDRICRAFAKVDGRFAKPYKLFAAKKYKEAAEAAGQIVDPTRATYLSAAEHFIQAESLTNLGRHEDPWRSIGRS